MKILLTGKSDFSYNRTQVLLKGLSQNPDVELIYFPILKHSKFDSKGFRQLSKECDFVYIPPFRHSDVRFIKKLSYAPIVFDALISKFLTRTIDHGKWWTAWEKSLRDKRAFYSSDIILMDTEAHRDYILKKYELDPNRVFSLPVGVDTDQFKPAGKVGEGFKVGFYGGFIPLQGIDKIVEAANLLRNERNLVFEIIGQGPTYPKVLKQIKRMGLTNIEFAGWVPYEELNNRINGFDLCLGIFGDSLKTDLVVPNKIYHYSALRKCTITKDTIGIREVFEDKKNVCLVKNTPEAIAMGIVELKNDLPKRTLLADNAYLEVVHHYNHHKIADRLLQILNEYSSGRIA